MVPITVENEVSFTNKYSLIATINHWGWYWARSGSHNCWKWSFIYKQIFFNCHYQPLRHFEQGSLLGFYQVLALIFLVLLQWQIGFECWRKVSQQDYIIHPNLQKSLNVPQHLPEQNLTFFYFSLQGDFVISDFVFGCDSPTYNTSPVWESSLLTQFSAFTALQSLVLEKHCKGARSTMVMSMRSDDLTNNPCPSNSCEAEC